MSNVLNRGQEQIRIAALDWFRNSSSQLFQFEGPAGSGKTFLIFQILKSLGLKMSEVAPMAYTGQASLVMTSRGFNNARTIHSWLYEMVEIADDSIDEKYGVNRKKRVFRKKLMIDPNIKLFFIDEGYMVPENMAKDILSFGIKTIVCGDSHQLPPINSKPFFLSNSNVFHLTELMRQAADNPIVYLANRAMKGEPIHAGQYGNNVLVVNDDEFNLNMVAYADCILCGTNKTRDTLNSFIRYSAGFNTITPNAGERVICRQNNWQKINQNGIALTNGMVGTLISQPSVSVYDGKAFLINFLPDMSPIPFLDLPVNYKYFSADYSERLELKDFQNRRYLEGELFEFAYSQTVHLAQGSEYNNGIYIEEFLRPQIQNQLNYTAITRFKNSMIYIKKKCSNLYIPNLDKIYNNNIL